MDKLPGNCKKQKGSVAVEYMILTVFLGSTIAAGAVYLGQALNDQFNKNSKMVYSLDSRNAGGGGGGIIKTAQ